MFNRKIKLPGTVEEFNALIDKLCKKYDFKDKRHVGAVVSRVIRHIPNERAFTTMDYLYQAIHKSYANHVAHHMDGQIKHEVQVEQLKYMLDQDPNNQQALDELQKAAGLGSEKAKEVLKKLNPLTLVKPVS